MPNKRHYIVGFIAIVGIAYIFTVLGYAIKASEQIPDVASSSVQTIQQDNLSVYRLFELTNEERSKAGLQPVALDPELSQSAQLKSDDLVAGNYWAHENPATHKQGYDFILDTKGDVCEQRGENLAKGYSTNTEVMSGWMGSQTHRDTLLNPHYNLVGYGIKNGIVAEHFCALN